MSSLEPGSLLDVGCSDGALLDIAAAAGWSVLGIDPQPNSSERIVRGNFAAHQFSQKFDFLTFVHSFEHMDDPCTTLRKCRSVIRQDGRLLIVVPNFGGWWSRVMGKDWQWLNPDDHRYHYTREALARLLEQFGFRIEVCRTDSAFAPSLPEIIVSSQGVFDWPAARWRPARSALYRLSHLAGVVCNPFADFAGQGAELQVLARPV
jgi:SAM-dependent methyltransferase